MQEILSKKNGFNFVNIPQYLYSDHYDDRYFDVIDAINESRHIYFEGNKLLERLSEEKLSSPFMIGETGFGAGRSFIALMNYLEESGLKNLNIHYNSVELHPISAERMKMILSGFQEKLGKWIDTLTEAYSTLDISRKGWHKLDFQTQFGSVSINLYIGEAMEMLSDLELPCDIWFLDGHSPKKNPHIWRSELMKAIGEKTKEGGSFATFTVAVAVNKALSEAGFKTEKIPGAGIKRYVLRGFKTYQSENIS